MRQTRWRGVTRPHAARRANSDEYRAAVERFETARPTAARKPKNPAEALAWLITVAEHVGANLKEYGRTSRPDRLSVRWYTQWLSDLRRLRWFVDAVKAYVSEKNKKSLEQLLGLKAGRGHPVVQDRRNKILEKLVKIPAARAKGPTRKTRQGKPADRRGKKLAGPVT